MSPKRPHWFTRLSASIPILSFVTLGWICISFFFSILTAIPALSSWRASWVAQVVGWGNVLVLLVFVLTYSIILVNAAWPTSAAPQSRLLSPLPRVARQNRTGITQQEALNLIRTRPPVPVPDE